MRRKPKKKRGDPFHCPRAQTRSAAFALDVLHGGGIGLASTGVAWFKSLPEQLVNWLEEYLYFPPESLLLDNVSAHVDNTPDDTLTDESIQSTDQIHHDRARAG